MSVPRLTIEDIRQKVIIKDFEIKYSEAINVEYPGDYDYQWLVAAGGNQQLLHISVPSLGGVILKVVDDVCQEKHDE